MDREDKRHPVFFMDAGKCLEDSFEAVLVIDILLPVECDKEIPVGAEPEILKGIGPFL